MKQNIWILSLLLISLSTACTYDENVKASDKPELIYGKYTLPQGEHDYDPRIVEFYHKYSSLLLYKFNDRDFGWNVTGSILWNPVTDTTGGNYEYQVADELYVGNQLDLLEQKCFKYFPETWLQTLLPQRILLCSKLNAVDGFLEHYPTEDDKHPCHVVKGYHHFAINWGNQAILSMTAAQQNEFKIEICKAFLRYIYPDADSGNDLLGKPDLFATISTYSNSDSSGEYANGILDPEHKNSIREDWFDYIVAIISNSYEELTAERGILNSEVDVNGKIREKYDIMVNFFKNEHNFDIQAIGNDTK